MSETRYEMSQEEVAVELGVSRAMVGKIERKALRKCRAALEKLGYRAEDFLDGGYNVPHRVPPS